MGVPPILIFPREGGREREGTMKPIEVLDLLAATRAALLDYYRALGPRFPEHKRKWLLIATELEGHQVSVQKLRVAVAAKPLNFSVQAFTPQVATFLISDLKTKTADLAAGKLNLRYALTLAADAEKSFLESKLYDALKTDTLELTNLLYAMKSEGAAQTQLLRDLAAALPD